MIVHKYEKSYKGDSELDDYFRFKMAASANLRMDTVSVNSSIWVSSSIYTLIDFMFKIDAMACHLM